MGRTRPNVDDDEEILSPSMADVLARVETLGDVPRHRIRMRPLPGTATEADVVWVNERKRGLCELIEGTLVEKAVGAPESLLAATLILFLGEHARRHKLGKVLAPDGMIRIMPGLVRLPDVTFISHGRMPKGAKREAAVWEVGPDLVVEILSPSNTKGEITRKVRDYFFAECRLVWVINPKTRSADVYTAPDQKARVGPGGALDGGDVLPGFRLPLKELFAEADEEAPRGKE